MTAAGDARAALDALTPQDRERQGVLVVIAELLIEQNAHLSGLLAQGAGQPASNQGRSAVRLTEPATPPTDPDEQDGAPAPVKKAAKKAAPTRATRGSQTEG